MSTPSPTPQAASAPNATAARGASARVRVLSVEVENRPGVLFRVSGMIRRRGFNIQGLSVGPTDQAGRSRMTLAVDAGHAEVDQVEKQLDRLIEVIEIQDITEQAKQVRELVLLKLEAGPEQRAELAEKAARLGGRVIDESTNHVIVEIAGEYQPLQSFVKELEPFRIVELSRSGPVAMSRG
jgi:acetolactate synthase I/III small subunit